MSNSSGLTTHLFHAALSYVRHGSTKALTDIIQRRTDLLTIRSDGRGLIHAAAESGNATLLGLLLDAGADPDMPEITEHLPGESPPYLPGYTPLHRAAEQGCVKSVALLLSRGANPNAVAENDCLPLHRAKNLEVGRLLLEAGADVNAELNVRYFDLTLGWHYHGAPLHAAARGDAVDAAKLLIAFGGDVNQVSDCITQRTPLHLAAAFGHIGMVQLLLEHNADPSMRTSTLLDSDGDASPLDDARRRGQSKVVKVLERFDRKKQA